jgi:phosphoglycerate dehydrogenase-like enzyme
MGVEKCTLERLFSECPVISNHLANNAQTRGLLDYQLFSRMGPYASFINTGCGAQVVEADLIRALKEEPGRCALLDVTDPEPPEQGHPFYSMDNVFLTPHIAGSMGNEVARMGAYMLEALNSYLSGNPSPRYLLHLLYMA